MSCYAFFFDVRGKSSGAKRCCVKSGGINPQAIRARWTCTFNACAPRSKTTPHSRSGCVPCEALGTAWSVMGRTMVFDLKLAIFLGMLALLAAILSGILIGRRQGRTAASLSAGPGGLWQAFATLPFGVVFLSQDLRCLYANANACHLLGNLA